MAVLECIRIAIFESETLASRGIASLRPPTVKADVGPSGARILAGSASTRVLNECKHAQYRTVIGGNQLDY